MAPHSTSMSSRLLVLLLANTVLGAVSGVYSTNDVAAIAKVDAAAGIESAAAIAKADAAAGTAAVAAPNEPKPSLATQEACRVLNEALPGRVFFAGTRVYTAELYDYWSAALRELKPACMVFPNAPTDVQQTIKILGQHKEVRFSIKSGGHSPNAGASSTDGGVLISMANMRGVKYVKDKEIAYVKPGGKWRDVIGALNKDKVAVAGGRLGIVGVGGLLSQGGLSFLSAQYGLAADNIVEYEMVVPNGTLARVNMQNNPNLMVAMRGHGEQFGVITQYTLRTYPMRNVWGGYRIYTSGQQAKLFAALHDFIANGDTRAAIIFNYQMTVGSTSVYLIHYFYDGDKPPAGAFGKFFMSVPATIDFTTVRTYPELLNLNGAGIDMSNARAMFRTITLPYFPDQPQFYGELMTIWERLAKPVLQQKSMSVLGIAFQPIPNTIGKQSKIRGGNAMGLTDTDNHRFILEMSNMFWSPQLEPYVRQATRQLTVEARTLAARYLQVTSKPDMVERYLPLFMNDANDDQDVIGSYRDYDSFAKLQNAVDPEGMFSQRAGAIQFSKARKLYAAPAEAGSKKFMQF